MIQAVHYNHSNNMFPMEYKERSVKNWNWAHLLMMMMNDRGAADSSSCILDISSLNSW